MRSRQEILFNFGSFCPNLLAMAIPLAPLKFWIAYLKSPTPTTLLYTQNLCLEQKWR